MCSIFSVLSKVVVIMLFFNLVFVFFPGILLLLDVFNLLSHLLFFP